MNLLRKVLPCEYRNGKSRSTGSLNEICCQNVTPSDSSHGVAFRDRRNGPEKHCSAQSDANSISPLDKRMRIKGPNELRPPKDIVAN
jgi:hypothetical protein